MVLPVGVLFGGVGLSPQCPYSVNAQTQNGDYKGPDVAKSY